MCYSSNKVIKSDTTSFLALGGLNEDKLCDALQAMAPTKCQNGSPNLSDYIDYTEPGENPNSHDS